MIYSFFGLRHHTVIGSDDPEVVVAGTTGEFPALDDTERLALVDDENEAPNRLPPPVDDAIAAAAE